MVVLMVQQAMVVLCILQVVQVNDIVVNIFDKKF